MRATVIRHSSFNAAHRLHNPAWSDEKNREVFGLCNNPNYHGHNYRLAVEVEGEVDPETGYVIDLGRLQKVIDAEVIERFDHKNLNLDAPEFAGLNPSAEHIAAVIYHKIASYLEPGQRLTITLFETERNAVRYSGE